MAEGKLRFPKPTYSRDKRIRQQQKQARRLQAAVECIQTDGRCMNPSCVCHREPRWKLLGVRLVLQAHHIVKRSQQGADSQDNLITLCGYSHDGVHDGSGSLTGRQEMIRILLQHRGEDYWRWEKAFKRLLRKENITIKEARRLYGQETVDDRFDH